MYRLSYFLIYILSLNSLAQANLDSLRNVWKDKSAPIENRLEAMDNLCWDGYLFSRPDSAFYYAQLQFELAKKENIKTYMAKALKIQGVSHNVRGQHNKAITYHEQSLKIFESIADQKGISSSLNALGSSYNGMGESKKAIEFYEKSMHLSKENDDWSGIANAYNNIGVIYYGKGDLDKAIDYFKMSVDAQENAGDDVGLANSLNNIGNIYKLQGNYRSTIEYFQKSLKIREENADLIGVASSFNNIGVTYEDLKEFDKALDYYLKGLKIREKQNDKAGIAVSISNIGSIYGRQKNHQKALQYHKEALTIREELNDLNGTATSMINMGSSYVQLDSTSKARFYLNKGLEIARKVDNKSSMSSALNLLAELDMQKGNYQQALIQWDQAYSLASDSKDILRKKDAAEKLWLVNKKLGNNRDALVMYEAYVNMRDSLNQLENQKAVIRQEYEYSYEKQHTADSIKVAEERLREKEKVAAERKQNELKEEKSKQEKYMLFAGLALALVFGAFIFNRFRITKKQRDIIESQKKEVQNQKQKVDEAYHVLDEKNTEILDSINYAQRIQKAILPPNNLIDQYLPNSFVLYLPKDIVAGDFYWMEPYQGEKQNESGVLFAAADCTGHGVPGAMVSVVCNNGLNRSVREYGLTDPGQILDKTRELVISEFEKSEDEVKDGMDIALCSLTFTQKENQKQSESGSSNSSVVNAQARTVSDDSALLQYAGAHNPLWIIKADASSVTEVKADKQPIGKFENSSSFTSHTVHLNQGDTIYIFSDGFADQFGGPKGKKFKSANFKALLLSIQDKTMQEQKVIIHRKFVEWHGNLEQLDDVCVIGVRI